MKSSHSMSARFHGATMLVLLFALGCGGGPSTGGRTYVVRPPDIPPPAAAPPNLVIGVEQFSAVAPLNDWRILKYESLTQLEYYEEDQWVSQPATMIPEVAARCLERMGIARQAAVLPWIEKMDYVLQGQILSFEEVHIDNQHTARVAFDLTLLRFPKREVVWSGTYRAQQAVAGNDVPAAVEALSLATHEVLRKGFEDMARSLPAQP